MTGTATPITILVEAGKPELSLVESVTLASPVAVGSRSLVFNGAVGA